MSSEPLTGFHILGPLIGLFLILGAVIVFLLLARWFLGLLRRLV
ncbi:hypothetical protein [Thermococcus onnurineus]|nr:hypothetical protein [Thermococcus onnurineus]